MIISASVLGALVYIAKHGALYLLRSPAVHKFVISKFKRKPKFMVPPVQYASMIELECKALNIDSDLFCAIVNTESAWRPNAVRYEENFNYLWHPQDHADAEKITLETETVLQRMSYGLCQLMGANARWLGYDLPLMTLLDPATNIKMGVRFFAQRCNQYSSVQDKIAAYNAGTPRKKEGVYINQPYVDRVYGYYSDLRKSKT